MSRVADALLHFMGDQHTHTNANLMEMFHLVLPTETFTHNFTKSGALGPYGFNTSSRCKIAQLLG